MGFTGLKVSNKMDVSWRFTMLRIFLAIALTCCGGHVSTCVQNTLKFAQETNTLGNRVLSLYGAQLHLEGGTVTSSYTRQ